MAGARVSKRKQREISHVAAVERVQRGTVLKRARETLEQMERNVGLLEMLQAHVSHVLLHLARDQAYLRLESMAQEVEFPGQAL